MTRKTQKTHKNKKRYVNKHPKNHSIVVSTVYIATNHDLHAWFSSFFFFFSFFFYLLLLDFYCAYFCDAYSCVLLIYACVNLFLWHHYRTLRFHYCSISFDVKNSRFGQLHLPLNAVHVTLWTTNSRTTANNKQAGNTAITNQTSITVRQEFTLKCPKSYKVSLQDVKSRSICTNESRTYHRFT